MRIAVDIMGGDQSPSVLFEGVCLANKALGSNHQMIALAEEGSVPSLEEHDPSIQFLYTGPSIAMEASPFSTRNQHDSSMAVGLAMLKEKTVDAFVTTGNTGALVVNSRLHVDLIEGVSKPGLLAKLPSAQGSIALIDAGALLQLQPENMLQFAKLGALYQNAYFQKKKISVGLLNIGSEKTKGTGTVKEAFEMLQTLSGEQNAYPFTIEFLGNVEAREVFSGKVDVIVTDGFTGNVFLKSSEGTSKFILDYTKNVLSLGKDSSAMLGKAFHYHEYPGAVLCGVDGLIVKSHGYSTAGSFHLSILEAVKLHQAGLIEAFKTI